MTPIDAAFGERLLSRNSRNWAIPMEDGFLVADGNIVLRRVRGNAQLYELLKSVIDKVRTGPKALHEVIEEVGRYYPPLLVTKAVERFVQVGLLEFRHPAAKDETSTAVADSHVLVVGNAALAERLKGRMAGWGCGGLDIVSADPVKAGQMIEWELAELDKITFCIAVAGSEIERLQLFPAVNRACLERGILWLSGYLNGERLFVGPLFVPRETGCYSCLEAREEAHDAHLPELQALRSYVRQHAADVDSEPNPLALDTLLNLLALETFRVVSRTSFPTTYQTMVEVSLVDYRTQHHTLLRVPVCEVCGPFTTQPFRLAWDI